MIEIGYALSSEEHGPAELVRQAQLAAEYGIGSVWISDHFHPWLEDQGESPFVWSVIGAIAATTPVRVGTAVTCPMIRTHPALIAQAAATCSVLLDGRFELGVGTGENLNEHIYGDRWPPSDVRRAMLDEAVEVMRALWTGEEVTHRFWRSSGVPGELSQDLPTPAHFEQASTLVSVEAIGEKFPCGPDVDPIVAAAQAYIDAGADRIFLTQIGPDQDGFFKFFESELADALAQLGAEPVEQPQNTA